MASDDSAPPPTSSPSPAPEPTQSIDRPPSTTNEATDSAPPPTSAPSSASPIPPRDYNNPSSGMIRPPPLLPPAYAPNSTVPNFIRTLAIVVFVIGGTSAAAIAWVYKNILYPRLVLALQARTTLHQSHLVTYTSFVESINRFGRSSSRKLLGGLSDPPPTVVEGESSDEKLLTEGVSTEVTAIASEKQHDSSDSESTPLLTTTADDSSTTPAPTVEVLLPPPEPILDPLLTSLTSLSSMLKTSSLPAPPSTPSISHYTPPRSAAAASAAAAAVSRLSPDHTLLTSLGTLNSYVENELYAVVSQGYRTYGSVSGSTGPQTGGKERKALGEATAGFKSEIRAVKGLLLNRRNFAVGGAGAASRVGVGSS